MIHNGFVWSFFPLHNEFELNGIDRTRPIFEENDVEAWIKVEERDYDKINEQFKSVLESVEGLKYIAPKKPNLAKEWAIGL